jgi:GTP-binding protein
VDLIDSESLAERRQRLLEALSWQGPVYEISAIAKQGTMRLAGDLMTYLESLNAAEAADPERVDQELQTQHRMQEEARARIEALRLSRAAARRAQQPGDEDDDDEAEWEYRP